MHPKWSSQRLIPGSSFGLKKVPDLNPAKFSAGLDSKQNAEGLKKHPDPRFCKNRQDERLDHTQATCLCATSSFSGAQSFHNTTLKPSRSHCPRLSSEMPKSRTTTYHHKIEANLCPSKDFQEQAKEYVAKNPLLQSGVLSPGYFGLTQELDPLINVAELMVPVKIQNLQKIQSGKLRQSYGKLSRSYDAPALQNIAILNNTGSTAQNLSGRLCKPDILKQWEYIIAYVLSA